MRADAPFMPVSDPAHWHKFPPMVIRRGLDYLEEKEPPEIMEEARMSVHSDGIVEMKTRGGVLLSDRCDKILRE